MKFRRSLYFVKSLKVGDEITPDAIRSVRPGFGLPTKYADALLGKRMSRDVNYGTAVAWQDLGRD